MDQRLDPGSDRRAPPGGICHELAPEPRSRTRRPSEGPCSFRPGFASFDTRARRSIYSLGRRRARRFRAHGAFSCLQGSEHPIAGGGPRGLMERIARSLDEADLPAKEAPPRQGTRLPCPDEVDRRSTDPGRSPRSWPEAADGLIERGNHPPRLVMLSRPRDFATLQETGAVRSHPLLVVRFPRTHLETTRFGLATGRKLGGAVIRNRLRRRLREALRALAPSFQPGWDVLIIARPALVNATHEDLTEAVARLLRRGGVLEGPNSA